MPELKADIDYTSDAGAGETTFSANTPAGEKFLGGRERTVWNVAAAALVANARATGLKVEPFF
jgi:hypothetical protein